MSVNKVILIGNLGRDPEVRFTSNGRAVARFSIATTDGWKDAEGNRQERKEWHNIVVWGKPALNTCPRGGRSMLKAAFVLRPMTTRAGTSAM